MFHLISFSNYSFFFKQMDYAKEKCSLAPNHYHCVDNSDYNIRLVPVLYYQRGSNYIKKESTLVDSNYIIIQLYLTNYTNIFSYFVGNALFVKS